MRRFGHSHNCTSGRFGRFMFGGLILGLLLLLGTACSTMTHTIEVPVPVPCHVQDVPKPALPIDTVPLDADVFVVNRALWATIEMLEAHEVMLQAAIDACK